MTRTIEIAAAADLSSWDDLTGAVERTTMGFASRAFNLESATAGFNFADDAAVVTLPAHRVVRVIEDATASPTTLFWGRVDNKGIGRGGIFSGDARAFDVSLVDVNAEVRGIVIDNANRPRETWEARVRWFLATYCDGTWRPSTVLDRTTYFPLTHTTMADAKRYKATTGASLLSEAQAATGKLLFVTIDRKFFMDRPVSTIYASTIAINDDGTSDAETVFAPIPDTPADEQAGDQVTSGAAATYGATSNVVSVRRTAVETTFDRWEDALTSQATTLSGARNDINILLDGAGAEQDTVHVAIDLRADQVDLVAHGMTLSVRCAAAGITSPRTMRIAELNWVELGADLYQAKMQLGFPRKVRGRIAHGTPVPPVVSPPPPFTGGGGLCAGGPETSFNAAGALLWNGPGSVSGGVGHASPLTALSFPKGAPGQGFYQFLLSITETAPGSMAMDDYIVFQFASDLLVNVGISGSLTPGRARLTIQNSDGTSGDPYFAYDEALFPAGYWAGLAGAPVTVFVSAALGVVTATIGTVSVSIAQPPLTPPEGAVGFSGNVHSMTPPQANADMAVDDLYGDGGLIDDFNRTVAYDVFHGWGNPSGSSGFGPSGVLA